VVELTPDYVRMDGDTPSDPDQPNSRGQVFVLDGERAGELAGITRLGYDGTELPIATTEVVRSEVTTRDITGDKGAEIVVRGIRKVQPPAGQERVDVQGLFIYRVAGNSLQRIFSIETGREQGDKRVQGLVQFVPAKAGKGFDIDVRPGAAKGWTEKTYPWPQDPTGGHLEPLLLPWGKIPSLRYTWNGTQYVIVK
jgi:hypothetical protein